MVLARNFGHQAALSAGMDEVTGDVAVFVDADLQPPPEEIPRFLAAHAGDVLSDLGRERGTHAGVRVEARTTMNAGGNGRLPRHWVGHLLHPSLELLRRRRLGHVLEG